MHLSSRSIGSDAQPSDSRNYKEKTQVQNKKKKKGDASIFMELRRMERREKMRRTDKKKVIRCGVMEWYTSSRNYVG